MRYTYVYKTSDGVRHQDGMDADSREEVFEALRSRGIRAIKVIASDGSKANGEIRGVRKRMVALITVVSAALTAVLAILASRYLLRTSGEPRQDERRSWQAVYTGNVKEVEDYLAEREKLESEYRMRIEDRVKNGTLTRQEADDILQTVFHR